MLLNPKENKLISPLNVKCIEKSLRQKDNININNIFICSSEKFTYFPNSKNVINFYFFSFSVNERQDANRFYMPLYDTIVFYYIKISCLNNETLYFDPECIKFTKTINIKINKLEYKKDL